MNKDSGSLLELAALRVLANGLDHPEGIAVAPDGMLYAGGEAGQLYRIDPAAASHEQVAATGGFILGVCLDAAGRVYLCDAGRQAVLRYLPADGSIEVYCDSAGGRPLRWPNFPVFAADGSLWVSDSGTLDPSVIDGTLVRVPPGGGEGEILDLRPLHCSNGLALAPDDDLYVIESFAPRVSVLRADGLAPYVELPAPFRMGWHWMRREGCSSPATSPTASTGCRRAAASRQWYSTTGGASR